MIHCSLLLVETPIIKHTTAFLDGNYDKVLRSYCKSTFVISKPSNCQALITEAFGGGSVSSCVGQILDCICDTIKQIAHESLL